MGPRSALDVPLEAEHDVALTLVLGSFIVPGRSQSVQVVVNDTPVATLDLVPGIEHGFVHLPGRVVRTSNHIELRYAYAVSPKELGISQDPRELGVSVQRISFQTLASADALGKTVGLPPVP